MPEETLTWIARKIDTVLVRVVQDLKNGKLSFSPKKREIDVSICVQNYMGFGAWDCSDH